MGGGGERGGVVKKCARKLWPLISCRRTSILFADCVGERGTRQRVWSAGRLLTTTAPCPNKARILLTLFRVLQRFRLPFGVFFRGGAEGKFCVSLSFLPMGYTSYQYNVRFNRCFCPTYIFHHVVGHLKKGFLPITHVLTPPHSVNAYYT